MADYICHDTLATEKPLMLKAPTLGQKNVKMSVQQLIHYHFFAFLQGNLIDGSLPPFVTCNGKSFGKELLENCDYWNY